MLTDEVIEEFFTYDEKRVPDTSLCQIRPLVKTLLDAGWIHDDLHAGNFVENNGVVKIIDFDNIIHV